MGKGNLAHQYRRAVSGCLSTRLQGRSSPAARDFRRDGGNGRAADKPPHLPGYAQEMALAGEDEDRAFAAGNYGDFLLGHKRALIRHRYFTKEWPAGIVSAIADKTISGLSACLVKKPCLA